MARALYDFQCPNCGRFEDFAPVGAWETVCPSCKQAARRKLSRPVLDCHSIGHDVFPGRTPFHRRKPRNAAQEEAIWDAKQESRYVGGGEKARVEIHAGTGGA